MGLVTTGPGRKGTPPLASLESISNAIFDHLFSSLPASPLGWVVQIVGGLIASFVILTGFEWYIHKNMMHRKGLRPRFLYSILPTLSRLVQRHAVMHHNTFYKQFDYEPDPDGKHENINIRFYQTLAMAGMTAPFLLILGYISPVVLFIFMLGGYFHNKAWNILHTQMHMPREVWWKDSWYFLAVAYHHFMHHMQQDKNMNVVLPGADFVLGTVATPKLGDIREMVRLGYIKPRTARVQKMVASMKPRPGYTFEDKPLATVTPLRAAA